MAQAAPVTQASRQVAASSLVAQTISRPPRSLWYDAWRRLLRNKAAILGAVLIGVFATVAILAPVLAPYSPLELHSGKGFLPPVFEKVGPNGRVPDPHFVLGTDNLGRDVLSRIIYGARVSLVVGLVPTFIIILVGVSVGLFTGYRGGRTDNLMMRFADIVWAFPDLLFFIIVMTALRNTPIGQLLNGLLLLFVALAIINWVGVARLVRGQVLSLKEKEFIEAARMIGAGTGRIMLRHILPNSLGPIIIAAAFSIPGAIIVEATLGYLGLGLRPASDAHDIFITSWGSMLLEGQTAINAQPWLLLVPAACVATVVLAFNYVGDGLRDALDPRLAGAE